nr:hypothetical protein [Bradyrhizobium daqingense]
MVGARIVTDATLDRRVHNAYRIELKGDSLRKQKQSAPDQSVLDLLIPQRHHQIDPCD